MRRQAIEIGLDVAGDLQLVVAAAIVRNDLLQRLRQAVVDALHRRAVARRQRIDQAHRVAQLDRAGRASAPRGSARRGICSMSGVSSVVRMPGRLLTIIWAKELPVILPERVEDRSVEQRRTVGGDQRIEPQRRALLLLLAVGAGEQAERRVGAVRLVMLDGEIERLAELVEILVVGELAGSSRTTWRPAPRPPRPGPTRPSGSEMRTRITAWMPPVTVMTPKRKASRMVIGRS